MISSNGRDIVINIKGDKKVTNIQIDEDLIDVSNKDMLQDMLIVAINEAITKVEEEMSKALNGATGGMNIPGMF